ncbi:hypothetical protein JCM19045_1981 [Bacillus sp. JCM 19045]|nr:hypothetical protein JCM19045_1981 [Bacillus sp. JCM 19045]
MYTTQLTGLFKKINETQVESFEDAGRLLAQALSADGTLYVKAFDPFGALELAVTAGSEPLPHSTILDNQQLTSRDRVLLFLSDTSENQALALLELCQRSQTPTIVVASKQMDSIADACDVLLVTHATKGLSLMIKEIALVIQVQLPLYFFITNFTFLFKTFLLNLKTKKQGFLPALFF